VMLGWFIFSFHKHVNNHHTDDNDEDDNHVAADNNHLNLNEYRYIAFLFLKLFQIRHVAMCLM
jgi:hypothetical protein